MRRAIPFFFLLAGCAIGPNYKEPDVCMPEKFSQETEHHQASIDLAAWWEQFDDPLLSELIAEARACNYDMRIALSKIEEVRGLYKIDRSQLFPQLQGNSSAFRSRASETLAAAPIEDPATTVELFVTDFGGIGIFEFFQVGLDAMWEIDLFGKNRRRAKAAYREFEATQNEALAVQVSLFSEVAIRYITLRSLQQEIQAKKEQVEQAEEVVRLEQCRYQAGLTSHIALSQAELEARQRAATLPPLEEELQTTINGLAVLLGRPPEGFAETFAEAKRIPMARGKLPKELPSNLLRRRPDIARVERQLAAATERIGLAIAELFPSINLIGSFGVQSGFIDQLFTWPSRYWTIGPSLIWNLFTGGKLLGQVKVANERQKQALLIYERTIQEALQEVEDRLVGYTEEEKRLTELEDVVVASSLKKELYYSQFDAGLISLDLVLDAEERFYLAEQEMIESAGRLMVQLVGLYKALGGGWQCSDLP